MACALLYHNMAQVSSIRQGRLYWIDVTAAIKLYLDKRWPQPSTAPPAKELAWEEFTPILANTTQIMTRLAAGLPDGAFWRTVRPGSFLKHREMLADIPAHQDAGRARLLAWGYARLGGIAPHLPQWLAALVLMPILGWATAELWAARFPAAAVAFGALVPSSMYVIQSLALGHSPFGFYLVALVSVVALSAYSVRDRPTSLGVLARASATGGILAVCVLCRSGSILLAPGFAWATIVAAGRIPSLSSRRKRAVLVLSATALIFVPSFEVRQSQRHPVWAGFWEGLGDFDAAKSYYWDDAEARRALAAAGLPSEWVDLAGPQAETYFREKVLSDILGDPLWYLDILARRFVATAFQPKLWPRGRDDGKTYAPSTRPNEGRTDGYYTFTPTADLVVFGSRQWELPVPLMVAPALLLLLFFLARRRRKGSDRLTLVTNALVLFAGPWLAALTLPVLVTTAAAQEMQAIALAYFVGLGLFLDALHPWAVSQVGPS